MISALNSKERGSHLNKNENHGFMPVITGEKMMKSEPVVNSVGLMLNSILENLSALTRQLKNVADPTSKRSRFL